MENNKDFFMSLYADLPLPFLVADKEGYILSANKALSENFPSLKINSALSLVIPKETVDAILSCKNTEEIFLIGLNVYLTVLPFSEYVGLLLHKKEEKGFNDKMMASLLLPVPHIFRSSISEMLMSVSSIYAIGEENEDERLIELSKKLNLNCYKILRGNNLISSYCRELSPKDDKGEAVELASLLKTVAEAARVIVNDCGVELKIDIKDKTVPVKANEASLTEAIIALIDNACKFSHSKEPVTVRLSKTKTHALISVTDKGIGIPEDVMGHIFEPYYSFDREASPLSGVGLGLTLARLIAVKWGGNVSVSSKDYEGTTAVLSLPLLKEDCGLEFNSKVTLTNLLRDRFSVLNVMFADNGTVPTP